MSDSALPAVTLRREDFKRILEDVGRKYITAEYDLLTRNNIEKRWAKQKEIIAEAIDSIKPVEEDVEFPDKVMGFTIPEIKKIIDFYRIKTGLDSPVNSEEKCEHDKGNFWKENGNKHNLMTDKADGKKCPFCPKPEERSPEEIAEEILGECKCKEPSGGRGGSESFTCDLHIYGNEFIQAINNERQRNRGGGK